MTFDAGNVVGLVLGLVFIGSILWAELHSRRQRRTRVDEEAASRDGGADESREPSNKR